MDGLRPRLRETAQAVNAMQAALDAGIEDRRGRDRAIVWFAFAFEAMWPLAAAYLHHHAGIEADHPETAIAASQAHGLLGDGDAALARQMVGDCRDIARGQTTAEADETAHRLSGYAGTLKAWLAALQRSLDAA